MMKKIKKVINKIQSWRQDRQRLSMEKHELSYVRKLAKEFIDEYDGLPDGATRMVLVGQLRRLCRYCIKVKP